MVVEKVTTFDLSDDVHHEAAADSGYRISGKRKQSVCSHAITPDKPTTYVETLMHILKGNVGSGVFAMGDGFKNGGLILSPIFTLILGLICVHSQHILLECSQRLKVKFGNEENPDFAETVEMCFESGPKRVQCWSKAAKLIVNIFLCVTQMGFCCVYFIFISASMKQIFDNYGIILNLHLHMLIIFIPILLPCLITNLKYLAFCSAVANVCMATGIGVVFYYALQEIPNLNERKMIGNNLPLFFGTTIFAFEGIALVLPLKNSMLKASDFDRPFGVLNIGMIIVTITFTCFGFVGYLKWGDETQPTLTLNLPQDDILAILVKIVVSLGMALTFPLQFFVPIQIMWPWVERKFLLSTTSETPVAIGDENKNALTVELIFRTFLVIIIFGIAETVPKLGLFISLIGSLCSSALALAFPPLIQLISEGTDNWFMVTKNLIILVVAILGFTTGTYESVSNIINEFFGSS